MIEHTAQGYQPQGIQIQHPQSDVQHHPEKVSGDRRAPLEYCSLHNKDGKQGKHKYDSISLLSLLTNLFP